ncbi:MAG: AmmeMemoRadiSam system protein A [Anaerolineae bacterium]|jgi:AmmeMemoRadiSam system protein A
MALSPEDRRYLLTLARQSIARALEGQDLPEVDLSTLSEALRRPGASFVTLTLDGELRGCIGSIEPRRPLARDVQENAIAAAFHDPRFPPLSRRELDRTHIEISVLTVPQPLEYEGPADLLAKLRPEVDGVIIERGWHRATFLPQVWEKLPDPREFMAHLCLKAGLPADDYRRPGLRVYTYQVEKFEEETAK